MLKVDWEQEHKFDKKVTKVVQEGKLYIQKNCMADDLLSHRFKFVFPTFKTVLFSEALLITLCSTNKRSSSISSRRSFSHSKREVVVAGLSKELLRPGERRLHHGPPCNKICSFMGPALVSGLKETSCPK